MRQLLAIFLFTAFLAQTFSKAFVVVDYYANTAAFAQNCVNKSRPSMHCNGKCQMMKKMEQQQKKDAENERKAGPKLEVISSKAFFASVSFYATGTAASFFTYNDNAVFDRAISVFHPPAIS
ncbi:hypothetical protein [Filimonas effusa]|uniref:Transmembrane protein n=1 Tax=Filimonas effusa TaxID=2508721 RepID=A0A4Q1D1A6_9BACT|nr:hypothetical protein [Filimonas effusa]RXK80759.1 hypothetical protein ESB13_21590 [Filimonas effusa]